MSPLVLSSPAKLNLFLKVQNKRPDGYHNIVTIFERIDLADEITFCPGKDRAIQIVCDHPDVPVGPKNLVHKAARLLQEGLGVDQGAKIRIKKRIPVAAGLAGGSSNAATALLGLNHIWKLNLGRAKMLSYARKIGSDVAFFLHNASFGLGTGRGDHIRTLNIKTKLWHVLVVPCMKMYSWKVYGSLKLPSAHLDLTSKTRSSRPTRGVFQDGKAVRMNMLTKINDDANILIRNLKKDNVLEAGSLLANDLGPAIVRISPSLERLKERLKSLDAKGVMISGSGPSVFGLTMTKKEAETIKSVLSKRFAQVFVVKTL